MVSAALVLACAPSARAATYTVTNTNDSGAGSLRQAILDANANAGPDTIDFNIAPGGIVTIQLSTELPIISDPVVLDGTTHAGFAGAPLIEVGGTSGSPLLYGFAVAANATIRGFAIHYASTGIEVDAGNVTIAGNYVGTNAFGCCGVEGVANAIVVAAAATVTIGGSTAAERNIIIGTFTGIDLGVGTTASVKGNYFGLTPSGGVQFPLPAGAIAIRVTLNAAATAQIGGTTAGERNVLCEALTGISVAGSGTANISGNYIGVRPDGATADGNTTGVEVDGGTANLTNNVISGNNGDGISIGGTASLSVKGNLIGTDSTGSVAVANGGNGITRVSGTLAATIGGTTAAERNVISGNNGAGISLGGATTAAPLLITGNFVGLNAAGTSALANGQSGISITDGGFQIGGSSAGQGNDIAGNSGSGVVIAGTSSGTISGNLISSNGANGIVTSADGSLITGNTIDLNAQHGIAVMSGSSSAIKGNFVGTDVTSAGGRGNTLSGVYVATTGTGTVIGGLNAADANVIGGNGQSGIEVAPGAGGVVIAGNLIGIGPAGLTIANAADGVLLGNSGDLVGGLSPAARNVISGNALAGVRITASNDIVEGNLIGTDLAGTGAKPNGDGVIVAGSSNSIGGTPAGAANVIAFNTNSGVTVNSGTGNAIRGNAIHDNGALGIDLFPIGFTGNDPLDGDTGANNLQNFPQLTSAIRATSGTTTIAGVLSSAPSATYSIDFYASSAADPTGYGEGQRYLGSTAATSSGTGDAPFTFTTSSVLAGEFVTATATSATGDTSEFGQAIVVSTPGTLQFSAPVYSISEAGPTVTITVTRSGGSAGVVTVDYATSNGTATAGSDYTATSGTLTFADAQTSKTFAVPIIDDSLNEPNETFTIALSNATGGAAIGAPATATVTIIDNDPLPSLTINDVSVPEGNSGTTPATFTVTLTPASGQTVSVNFSTSDQTAIAGSDYVAQSGTLTFNPGETSKTVAVLVNGDTVVEPDETFALNLLNPVNATISRSAGIGTIVNDDGVPQITINDVAVIEGNSGTTNAVMTVSLSVASSSTVTVNWATADGTATAGSDYTASSGTVTFNPGVTTQTISIPVIGDTLVEGNETFFVNLSVPANATIADAQGSVTIADDDGSPVISINDVAMPEGNSGTTNFVFTVMLAPASALPVTVNYATADATATAGSDYTAVSGTITFSPGETTKTISVPVIGDTIAEPNETFFVNLSGATGAMISDNQGVGTIINDDGPPQISIGDVSLTEGTGANSTALFTVTLSASSASPITVNYATADGTANAGSDYIAASGTLTFNPGETVKTIAVTVIGDAIVESNETFFVNLSAATNAVITRPQATGTIVDDDALPSLAINDVTQNEGNSGTTNFAFTVTLTGATSQTVTVNYTTADGTANAGSDYAATSGTLTFAPGTTTRTINVAVVGDTTVEPNETFTVNLSGPVNATISRAQGTGTIVNDDSAPGIPSISIGDVSLAEGNSGTTDAVFEVTLSAPAATTVTVQYATANGTAIAGSDYVATSGTIVFSPGSTLQIVKVGVIGDTIVEPDETFFVDLTAAAGATIARGRGTGTILNDDVPSRPAPPVLPSLFISDTSTIEGDSGTHNAIVTLMLSAPPAQGASVQYATADQTATAGSDYQSVGGTVTFGPGDTAKTIAIPIIGDTVHEADETFLVRLLNPSGLTLARADATVTIIDDDAPAPTRMIFTVVGSVAGAASSQFRTALQLLNPTDAPMAGMLVFHPMNATDAASDVSLPYALAAGQIRYFSDLVHDIGASGIGTVDLRISSGALPVATARVYNDGGAAGTSGFVLPALLPSDALPAGSHAALTAPPDAIAMRFNIGVRALDEGATMTITVRSAAGDVLTTIMRSYAPNLFTQIPAADFASMTLAGNDYITIDVTAGRAIVYGSWIDNITNDPSVQLARRY